MPDHIRQVGHTLPYLRVGTLYKPGGSIPEFHMHAHHRMCLKYNIQRSPDLLLAVSFIDGNDHRNHKGVIFPAFFMVIWELFNGQPLSRV